jgi:Glyoxalase-like domain
MTIDPSGLANFWSAALGLTERRDLESETIVADAGWNYPRLAFQKVVELSDHPRQLHLDLTADDRSAEVLRLLGLGATELRGNTMEGGDRVDRFDRSLWERVLRYRPVTATRRSGFPQDVGGLDLHILQ